jgi:hypothetical protein
MFWKIRCEKMMNENKHKFGITLLKFEPMQLASMKWGTCLFVAGQFSWQLYVKYPFDLFVGCKHHARW